MHITPNDNTAHSVMHLCVSRDDRTCITIDRSFLCLDKPEGTPLREDFFCLHRTQSRLIGAHATRLDLACCALLKRNFICLDCFRGGLLHSHQFRAHGTHVFLGNIRYLCLFRFRGFFRFHHKNSGTLVAVITKSVPPSRDGRNNGWDFTT